MSVWLLLRTDKKSATECTIPSDVDLDVGEQFLFCHLHMLAISALAMIYFILRSQSGGLRVSCGVILVAQLGLSGTLYADYKDIDERVHAAQPTGFHR